MHEKRSYCFARSAGGDRGRVSLLAARVGVPASVVGWPDRWLWAALTAEAAGVPCRGEGVDPDDWHPVAEEITPAGAAALCVGCPLVAPCLTWAMRHAESGVWGGTTETERVAAHRNARRAARRAVASSAVGEVA
ncbi:MAG: WhiB family transcriptional regulator [Actinobacteria bacterium]|nr:WhiB family transcriptional regulator [Actinomycetota bacterium]MBI3688559.1 WhiB family transcriptional regulator [Actinomycetota bacterium]